MTDFFISYNKADKAWAEWIAWQLEEADYTTVLQAWDFAPGTNFVLRMNEAAKEAERTIAVLSPDYLASNFAAPEWAAAFAQDPTGEKGLLVPIRVRKCDASGLLGPIVYQDLLGLDEAAAKVALLAAVKLGRAKPNTKPAFPPTAGHSITSRPRFPGALPPIWNVPHRRNPNFTGREELLQSLHASLTSGDYAALTQAMHGLGGVGKTQTAIEYAYRYASEYDAVLWVPAEDPAALASHFAALASAVGLDLDLADQPAAVTAVQKWLREHLRWLLIFDNVESAAGIQPYLPQTGTGHVMITSRNPEWRRVAKPLPVERLAHAEAMAFLLMRAGRDAAEQPESAATEMLVEELGGLALALEQAAAYVETHEMSLAEYLQLFQEHREAVLSGESSSDYPHTIETVWDISFQAVQNASGAAAELLSLLAFFAPDDIPLTLLRVGAEHFPMALAEAAQNDLKLREAIRVLRRHSLLQVDGDMLSVHRVVQAVTRNTLSEVERNGWVEVAIRSVRTALPAVPANVRTWPVFARLSSHASAAAHHCETYGVELPNAGFCLNQVARYLSERADYSVAKVHFERAIRVAETAFGPDHVIVAAYVNNLGVVLKAVGDLPGARAHHERALQIDEAAYGPDHTEVATDVNNLGGVLHALADLDGARASFERALRIYEMELGPDHPSAATCVNNLGSVLEDIGDLSAARASYERALRIDQTAFGPDDLCVARDINNLAGVLQELGDLTGARANYERALRIYERMLGPDHPDVAKAVNNLSVVLRALGDRSGAQVGFERALRIDEVVFGRDHPDVAKDLNNLARVLEDIGDFPGARASYERALVILCQALGRDHPNTRIVQGNLQILLRKIVHQRHG